MSSFHIRPGEELTEKEVYYLRERIEILFQDKEEISGEEMLMLAYIQGMVEALIKISRPDIANYEGSTVLMDLANRAGGLAIHDAENKDRPDPRRN